MTTDYETLIESFVAKRLSAGEFEKRYLKAFKSEPGGMETKVFEILEKLFSDVDSYSPDCQEGKESAFEISEVELRRQAAKALNDLRRLRDDRSVSQR
jgi:hypothetical protein